MDYALVLWAGGLPVCAARVLRAASCTFTVSCMIAVCRHVFESEVYVDFLFQVDCCQASGDESSEEEFLEYLLSK